MIGHFLKDTGGQFAIMFALFVTVLLAGAGFAVDASGMHKYRRLQQSYADSAVLAARISGSENQGELTKIARETVNSNNTTGTPLTTQLIVEADGTYRAEVTGTYKMFFMGILGQEGKRISTSAEAPPTGGGKVNLAMVLDVTKSMEGPKMDALQLAATNLVDTVTGGVDGENMISIIPFAKNVELPMSMAGETWLDIVLEDDCDDELDLAASTNCREEWVEDEDDGVIEMELEWVCDIEVEVEVCEPQVWEGCVGSRPYPWNTRDYYGGAKIPGITRGAWCDDEILPLTTSVAAMKDKIDDVDPSSETYIPAGLIWGWRSLSPEVPLTEANTADYAERRNVMLLMTDGTNTRSIWDDDSRFHWGKEQADADQITKELCEEIKMDGIVIYSVAFEVDDVDTKAMLRDCASDPGKYFDAANPDDLLAAFDDVGSSLSDEVRLSR